MTLGVGGSSIAGELASLKPMRRDVEAVTLQERQQRIAKAQSLMDQQGVDALYLDASTSLTYFTGLKVHASERLHGAIIPASGEIAYICPAFEEAKLESMLQVDGQIRTWQEHEDPTALIVDTVRSNGRMNGRLALDEATPFFTFDGLRRAGNAFEFVNGAKITGACRMIKSEAELALMQMAKDITLEVQKACGRILHDGITTTEVEEFVTQAHHILGADGPPTFCIVLFGEPTAYPHGVDYPQTLRDGDMVLIDTGVPVEGYHSDITRSYVFGEPNQRQRDVWELEKEAQVAAFDAARVGATCQDVDRAARRVVERGGFGPGYAVPGLPHRTGHGIGLDIHEWEYLVEGNEALLQSGMCFSNEPMICIYGEFGVRLEDHFYMGEDRAHWFTEPCHSVDDPFGYKAK